MFTRTNPKQLGTPQLPNSSLKRDGNHFKLSTAAFSSAQTINRYQQNNSQQNYDNRPILTKDHYGQYNKNGVTSDMREIGENKAQSGVNYRNGGKVWGKLKENQAYHMLDTSVNQGFFNNVKGQNLVKYHTRSYCYTEQSSQYQNTKYHITSLHNFPPQYIKQIHDQQLAKSVDGFIQYNYGNLQKCGYFYFSIQKQIIFIKSLNYLHENQNIQPIKIQLPKHALTVKQIFVKDLEIDDIQRHPFGQKSIIFLIWYQWQVQFYSFQPNQLVKLKNLNMKFSTLNQSSFLFDYCQNGNIYYMNQYGQIGMIQLFHQNMCNLWNISAKFSIREHFYKMKNNTKRKHEKLLNSSILQKINEFYLDSKYYWSEKKTKGISITCDRSRNIIYTLTQTSIKQQYNLNRLQTDSHRELRMYDISKNSKNNKNNNFIKKIKNQLFDNNNVPKLLQQLTQQKLYYQIGVHLWNNFTTTLGKFRIVGVEVVGKQQFMNVGIGSNLDNGESQGANVVIVLENGSRLYLGLGDGKIVLVQMINLPNLDTGLLKLNTNRPSQPLQPQPSNNPTPKTLILSQKEPKNFKLIKYKFTPQTQQWAMIGIYKKSTIALLLSQLQCFNIQNYENIQQVKILWQESLQFDRNGALSLSMFVSAGDFRIYGTPEFQNNLYKKKLVQYKYYYQRYRNNKNTNKSQKSHKYNQKFPFLSSNQPTNYPRCTYFVHKSHIKGITKLRSVDIIISVIQKCMNNFGMNFNINALLLSDIQMGKLVEKIQGSLRVNGSVNGSVSNENINVGMNMGMGMGMGVGIGSKELFALLVQIFCDVDGVYYSGQNIGQGWGRRKRQQVADLNIKTNKNRRYFSNKFNNINLQRQSSQTEPFPSNPQQQQQQSQFRHRLTQKFEHKPPTNKNIINKINILIKNRYSDLCTNQNYLDNFNNNNVSNRYSTSPIKIRSQHSCMKIVQKLIIYLVKYNSNNNNNNNNSSNNRYTSIFSPSSSTSTSTSPLYYNFQQGIILYLSQLLSSIWHIKIQQIRQILSYINQILKRICQLIRIVSSNIVTDIGMHMNINNNNSKQQYNSTKLLYQIQQLCLKIIQFNNMINILTVPVPLTYSQGLTSEYNIFQQYIFYTLNKKHDKSSYVNQWRLLFPNYFTLGLYKAMKIQAEIALIVKYQDRKQAVIQNSKKMPYYLLYSYFRDGTITRNQFTALSSSTLINNISSKKSSNVPFSSKQKPINNYNTNSLIMTNSMDPLQKVQYALKQIKKQTTNLDEKQLLVTFAYTNFNNIVNLSQDKLSKKRQQIKLVQKSIKMQKLIMNEVNSIKQKNKNEQLTKQTQYLINNVIMPVNSLKKLIQKLKNPLISIIFHCYYLDYSTNITQLLQQLKFDNKDKLIKADKYKNKIKIISDHIQNLNTSISLSILLPILDQLLYHQLKQQNLLKQYIKSSSNNNNIQKIQQKFWVPLFLQNQKYNSYIILDYYTENIKKYSEFNTNLQRNNGFGNRNNIEMMDNQFLYYWISGFAFVKFRYFQGRRGFINLCQGIFRGNQGVNGKILEQFAKDKLAY